VTLENLLTRLVSALGAAQVPYMLTGSVASSAHGLPRSTRDLDIVISPTRAQLLALMQQFPNSSYYADTQQAVRALDHGSQFNVIDFASGWKVDFIIAEQSIYGRTAMSRRKLMNVTGTAIYIASAEDVLIAKMRWAKLGHSERQLQDAAGILGVQADALDIAYIEHWVAEFGLQEPWKSIREKHT
jgi:hypothetical protein